MNKQRIYVDVHVLQTLPPSCLNRDDTGSPKTAVYGGVTRARVSSQAWKRAMRDAFKGAGVQEPILPESLRAVRTIRLASLLHQEVMKMDPELPVQLSEAMILLLKLKAKKNKDNEQVVEAMFFLGNLQAKQLANVLVENQDNLLKLLPYLEGTADDEENEAEGTKRSKGKKTPKIPRNLVSTRDKLYEDAKAAIASNQAAEIALFGRMVAKIPNLGIDAAAQVAHAISTHKVNNEFDYFTAVDDLAPEDSAGAAHIGMVEFNSSTMYRYATLAVHLLEQHLGGDATETALGFVRAFITSMPTGKQNTFANRTLPDSVMVTVRKDQPINLVGAFEKPVQASEEGYVARSVEQLKDHALKVYEDYAGAPVHAFVIGQGLQQLGERVSLDQLIERLGDALVEAEAKV